MKEVDNDSMALLQVAFQPDITTQLVAKKVSKIIFQFHTLKFTNLIYICYSLAQLAEVLH